MATPVVMPQLSLSMREGIISNWYKKEGDFVHLGEPICVIEGDKATIDIEAPVEGYLLKIVAQEGEEFPVKQIIAYIGKQDETDYEGGNIPTGSTTADPATLDQESPTPSMAKPGTKIMASPVAKRLAVELGVDLASLNGTGPNGIISRDDVLKASEQSGVQGNHAEALPSVDKEFSPSGIKKLVAERMKESYLDAPHIHLTTSCVLSDASRLRLELNNKAVAHVTVTDLILLATGLTLTKHNLLNATFREGKIITFSDVNVGFAVASEKGLVVPVIRGIDQLSLINVAEARHALAERVRMGSQTLDDLNGGTFTVTNLGMFGIEAFDPIITPGQSGILAVGKIKNSLIVNDDGDMRIAPTMTITLACDHRVADGVDGAKFLADLVALLENPEILFADLL